MNIMDFVIFGSGGREHALAHFLARSLLARKLIAIPGNPGIESEHLAGDISPIECIPIGVMQFRKIRAFLETRYPRKTSRKEVLCVIGPEDPLAAGLADMLLELGFLVFGPHKVAARIEASKVFSQRFMARYRVPHADGRSFTNRNEAREEALRLGGRAAIKYPYPVKGKGVFPCKSMRAVDAALDVIFVEKRFGNKLAVVVQEYLDGEEVSFQAIYDGNCLIPFEPAQDSKRARDGDRGDMTGGVGAYSPVPFLKGLALLKAQQSVYGAFLEGCEREGIGYSGAIFPGLILTKYGLRVIEFNARFGDPEVAPVLSRLEGDLGMLLVAAAEKRLSGYGALSWHQHHAVSVVLASGGYPDKKKMVFGQVIHGLREAEKATDTLVLHSGTRRSGKDILTSEGRVLQVVGTGPSLKTAIETAYRAANLIEFKNKQMRHDIGKHALALTT